MRLKNSFASLMLAASVLSVPAIAMGCSSSARHGQGPEAHTMPMGNQPMADHAMTMNLGPKDAEFDLRFIDGMILHHEGAIAMAEALQANTQRQEMKDLAQAVIGAQQGEIDQMKQWRQDWYGQ